MLRTVSGRMWCIWVICIAAMTLAPFDFAQFRWASEAGRVPFQYGAPQQGPVDFALNVLMFLPVGALLRHAMRHRGISLSASLRVAVVTGFLISATVEYLQVFLVSRDSSFVDLAANTFGALVGVFADDAWGGHVASALESLRAKISRTVLVALIASFAIVALLTSAALQTGSRLSNWSLDFPLLIGNEQTGDRPWDGRLLRLEITAGATSAEAVDSFAAGRPFMLSGRRVAAYDFRSAPPYRDSTGSLPDLDWTARSNAEPHDGIVLAGQSWLRTAIPASSLARDIRRANAFTLRVMCASANTDQTGPARIVSYSPSTLQRNFTLGQVSNDLVFRLRTPATGLNGYPLEFRVPGVFAGHGERDILITYDGATLLATAAHGKRVLRAELTPGSRLALALSPYDVDLGALGIYKVAYLVALFIVPSVLLGLFAREAFDRIVLSGIWVVTFAPLLELALALASGRAFDPHNVVLTIAVGGLVLGASAVVFAPIGEHQRSAPLALASTAA